MVLSSITTNGYFDNVKGQVTGTKMKVLDTNEFTGSAKWLYAANYYDDRYRVIQSRRTLYDGSTGGVETLASQYEFTGRIGQTRLAQTFNSVTTTVNKYFAYDPQGRLTKTEQEIVGDSNNGRVTIAENVYNETGQLIDKKLHKVGASYLQNVDYTYNIRGWLKSINDPDNLSGDLFGERLLYETIEPDLNNSTDAQFNGNISGMVWNSTQKSKQGYRFTYDGLNRLTLGDHKDNPSSWTDNNNYEEKSLTYDKNGNIGTLIRSDQYGNNTINFTYNYNGNQLSNINRGTSYTYDLNGNTTTDGLRGMAIGYNILNLPNSITKSSDNISYIYSAAGEKLAKRMKEGTYQYYAGNMIYNDGKVLDYVLFDEGVVYKSSGAYTYTYHLKDHLGNTRVAFKPNGGGTETTQVAEYYPFGSNYSTLINGSGTNNKYLYNGKEKQTDELNNTALDEYDYGARFYDPTIGRFGTPDPMAEKYYGLSPFIYCANNPMRYIDPTGMEFTDEAWKSVNKLIADVNRRQAENGKKIAEKQAQLGTGGLSARQEKVLNRQIGRLEGQNTQLESVRGEVATLAASDQMYDVKTDNSLSISSPIPGMGEDRAGALFNFSNGNFDMLLPNNADIGFFAHELKHAYQFETGAFSTGLKGVPFYDQNDEKEAIARGALFGSTQSWMSEYDKLPQGPIDATNHPNIMHLLNNPSILQKISTQTGSAFRINGKTYKP